MYILWDTVLVIHVFESGMKTTPCPSECNAQVDVGYSCVATCSPGLRTTECRASDHHLSIWKSQEINQRSKAPTQCCGGISAGCVTLKVQDWKLATQHINSQQQHYTVWLT